MKAEKKTTGKRQSTVCEGCRSVHSSCTGVFPCARCERLGLECNPAASRKRGPRTQWSGGASPRPSSSALQALISLSDAALEAAQDDCEASCRSSSCCSESTSPSVPTTSSSNNDIHSTLNTGGSTSCKFNSVPMHLLLN